MSCLSTGIFVNPEAIPLGNEPRTTDNGRGLLANNCCRKNLDSRSGLPFPGCRAECYTVWLLDNSPEKLIRERGLPLGLVFDAVSLVDFTTGLCYKMARMRSADFRVGDRPVSAVLRFRG